MPIKYKNYHPDWKDIIRPFVLKRDNHKCKHCGIPNRTLFYRRNGNRVIVDDDFLIAHCFARHIKLSKVVLTIAHLDHDINNNEYINLAALCQSCHLRYDAHQHVMSRLISAANKRNERQGKV
jgi:5-methylcytosine-specific restriction endonuclease McrA